MKVLSGSEINGVARIGMSCCGVVGLEWSHKPQDSGNASKVWVGFVSTPNPPSDGLRYDHRASGVNLF